MGYRAPVSDSTNPSCGTYGGDGRLDVYLVSMTGADGMTRTDTGRCTMTGAASQCASFIYAQSNFALLYSTADIGIHTVLPHETFHVIQNAYNANIDRFWAEGTAQWAAKTLDPTLTDLERFLPAFFEESSHSIDAPANGVTSSYLYGAAVWPVFLTQRHGNGIVKSILEEEAKAGALAIPAADTVLQASQLSIEEEFPLFAAWNAATGKRTPTSMNAGYANATNYPLVSIAALSAAGATGITSGPRLLLLPWVVHVSRDRRAHHGRNAQRGNDDPL